MFELFNFSHEKQNKISYSWWESLEGKRNISNIKKIMAYKIKMTKLVVWFIIPIIMINWYLSMIKGNVG